MRRLLDLAARLLTRLLAHVFYREVEVRGLAHLPAEGPVVLVANHGNSLVDPLLLIARLPRMPRFLAKSTLWDSPVLLPLLGLAGAVPVYRRQDGGDMARNQDTFVRCSEELRAGGAVALFPEGVSHHEPAMQPLKTGAARIALSVPGARIVPVGLTFEDKGRFRSRVLLLVGEALVPAEGEDVRALTARVERALRRVTLNFESWELSRVALHAAEIYAEGERALPGRAGLGDRFPLRQAFGEGYARAREKHPERVLRVEQRAQHYAGMLAALDLRDDQVTARYPWSHASAYLGDRLGLLLLALPVAVLGSLLCYLPYRLSGLVGARVREQLDLPATYKILTGLVALPVAWALEAWAAAALWGGTAGWLALGVAPASGFAALLFHERYGSLWREVRAYLTLRLRPQRAEALRALRRGIRQEIEALVAEVEEQGAAVHEDPGHG